MSTYEIMDKSDRMNIISAEVSSSPRKAQISFRGEMKDLPVVRLPVNLPIYRMKNGRTQVEQYQHLEEVKGPPNFFVDGEENVSAQQAQHQILLRLSKEERGPIYQELEHVAIQKEPILLTSSGVVLNGNRRLAAMRELYKLDANTFEQFGHVNATILPDEATEQDLELLEAELQMAPETKLEYGWVERRLKLRHHLKTLKIPAEKIKQTYRFRHQKEINIEIQQLEIAEDYLETYLRKPRAYQEVALRERHFQDLEAAIRGKSGEESEVRRLLGYLLAKEASNLGDRVYDYRTVYGKDFDTIVDRFSDEEGLQSLARPNEEISDSPSDPDDPLNDLGVVEENSHDVLIPILSDQNRTQETAEKLTRIYDSLKEERRDRTNKNAAIRTIERANRDLNAIDLSTADVSTYQRIRSQLDAIIQVSENLKLELGELETDPPEEM